jgi:hypothetical protein
MTPVVTSFLGFFYLDRGTTSGKFATGVNDDSNRLPKLKKLQTLYKNYLYVYMYTATQYSVKTKYGKPSL